jgi:hypothetical protein
MTRPSNLRSGMPSRAIVPTDDEVESTEHLRRWVTELDNLERLLAIQEELLDDGNLIDETKTAQVLFRTPAGLTMLPIELVPWATALAERNNDLLLRARTRAEVAP